METFRTRVTSAQLPPYPADIDPSRSRHGFVLPRFTAETVAHLARDLERLANPDMPRILIGEGFVDVVDCRDPHQLVERVYADPSGRYPIGHGYWAWREHTDRNTEQVTDGLRAIARNGYKQAGPDEWTVLFADHGDWSMVIAVYQTPDVSETALAADLWFLLWQDNLSSYLVTAPDPHAAERAARRYFAKDRAAVEPDSITKPLALPNTRINDPDVSPA
jgi:hypothetical protein